MVSLPTQRVSPGRLSAAYRQEVERLVAARAIGKMWSRQATLWKSDADHLRVISNRLGWIGVLETMHSEAAALADFSGEIRRADLRDIVLLGMGGSSLAPEVFSLTFPAPAGVRRFFILDSTDPASILGVERAIDLRQTVFIVASKSGKTIETLSQFFYFHHRLNAAGIRPPGQNFIAITDPGSYLEQLAGEYSFRRTFLNPADIGGRYSALSYFGLVPAALWGADLAAVLDAATEMRAACGPAAPIASNPALELGALLGAGALNGVDKLFLLATPSLVPLGNWIEQLVAESTGKEGKGVVPVAGGVTPTPEVLGEGCIVAALRLEGEVDAALDALVESVKSRGVPVAEIRLGGPAELGGEFFKWEAATAVAGAVLGIDPFDEPNVQESKDNTARILERFQSSAQMPAGTPRLAEAGIELYAEGVSRRTISTLRLSEALRTFVAQRQPGDYLALLAFVDRHGAHAARLQALRARLGERLGVPVLLGYGPRYLHSIGQLYKGGPPTGMFLVITARPGEDQAIPGAKYTFAQLQMAQALGDLESLVSRDKPALRLHLSRGAEAGLGELQKAFEHALTASRPASS
jgi:glucose-6-phosphate isomerase